MSTTLYNLVISAKANCKSVANEVFSKNIVKLRRNALQILYKFQKH